MAALFCFYFKMEQNMLSTENNNQNMVNDQQMVTTGSNFNALGNVLSRKIILFVAGLILLLIILTGIFFNREMELMRKEKESQKIIDQAATSYMKGDLVSMESSLKKVISNYSPNAKNYASLITTIANEGNLSGQEEQAFRKGKIYADEALKKYPDDENVLIAVGYLYEVSGRYNDALRYYNKALSINTHSEQAIFHKAHALEFVDNKDDAFTLYKKAYVLNPTDPSIMMAYAKTKLADGKPDEALIIYKKAAANALSPAYLKSDALVNASILSRSTLSGIPDSVELSSSAVALTPNSSTALAEYGFALAMNGDSTQGIEQLKKSIEANPRISKNYWQLGLVYRAVKNYPSSIEMLNLSIDKIDNDNTLLGNEEKNRQKAIILYNLAQTYYWANMNGEALDVLKKSIALNPKIQDQLKSDLKNYEDFKGISADLEFQKLIQ